jgi:hypothetical protein
MYPYTHGARAFNHHHSTKCGQRFAVRVSRTAYCNRSVVLCGNNASDRLHYNMYSVLYGDRQSGVRCPHTRILGVGQPKVDFCSIMHIIMRVHAILTVYVWVLLYVVFRFTLAEWAENFGVLFLIYFQKHLKYARVWYFAPPPQTHIHTRVFDRLILGVIRPLPDSEVEGVRNMLPRPSMQRWVAQNTECMWDVHLQWSTFSKRSLRDFSPPS